jgi:HlyD family secretion protein
MPKPSARPNLLRRRWPWLVAILVVLLTAGLYWRAQRAAAADAGWRTSPAAKGDIKVTISSTGALGALSTVDVGSQVSGLVTEVRVDYNDPVRKGQVIARIDPSTFEQQIAQGDAAIAAARAQLANARATQANAEANFRRLSDLAAQQLVARSDLDAARAARDQAVAAVNAAEAQIRQQIASTQGSRLNLDRTVIRAPVDGVVLNRSVEPGQTVAASFQAPVLFQIAEDLSKMEIVLTVDEADIGQVKLGQPVDFTVDAYPDRQFKGVVKQIRVAAASTNNVVTYPVVVAVDNPNGQLLPGMTANAEIAVSEHHDVLTVPNAALRFKPAEGVVVPRLERRGSGSLIDDLAAASASLGLDAAQQQALDAALAKLRERAAARQRAGGGRTGGPQAAPGTVVVLGSGGDLQAQLRQRMQERIQREFADFRARLQPAQAVQWDAILRRLAGARRVPLYLLVNGQLRQVQVRVGDTDGTSTEVSGNLQPGDAVVLGKTAPGAAAR